MRNRLRTTIAAIALLSTPPAMAWTNTNNGHNNQIVDGGPGAQANARGGRGGNATGGAGGAGGHATGGTANATGGSVSITGLGSGGGNTGGYSGPTSAPTIFIPEATGQAPCGGGIGIGGAGLLGGGGGGGGLFEFGDCKRMRESEALRALAVETGDSRLQQAALNELCQIGRVKEAFGGSCPQLAEREMTIKADADKRDYCFTRDAGDRNQHRECDHVRRPR